MLVEAPWACLAQLQMKECHWLIGPGCCALKCIPVPAFRWRLRFPCMLQPVDWDLSGIHEASSDTGDSARVKDVWAKDLSSGLMISVSLTFQCRLFTSLLPLLPFPHLPSLFLFEGNLYHALMALLVPLSIFPQRCGLWTDTLHELLISFWWF